MKEALHPLKIHKMSQESLDTRRAISHSTWGESMSVQEDEENS